MPIALAVRADTPRSDKKRKQQQQQQQNYNTRHAGIHLAQRLREKKRQEKKTITLATAATGKKKQTKTDYRFCSGERPGVRTARWARALTPTLARWNAEVNRLAVVGHNGGIIIIVIYAALYKRLYPPPPPPRPIPLKLPDYVNYNFFPLHKKSTGVLFF